jgi:hypothetical protein
VSRNYSPDPAEVAIDEEIVTEIAFYTEQELPPLPENYLAPEPAPKPITGLDGKSYPRPAPKPSAPEPEPEIVDAEIVATPQPGQNPRRGPITDDAGRVAVDLGRLVKRLNKFVDDDRFDRNKEMIGNRIRPEVKFGLDVLGRIDRKINKPTDKVEDEVTDTIPDVSQYAKTLMAAFRQTFAPHRLQQLHASDRREFLLEMKETITELEKLELVHGGDRTSISSKPYVSPVHERLTQNPLRDN